MTCIIHYGFQLQVKGLRQEKLLASYRRDAPRKFLSKTIHIHCQITATFSNRKFNGYLEGLH